MTADLPVFAAPYAADDVALARQLFAEMARLSPEREARIDAEATLLIDAIRSDSHGLGGIEDVLREYALSTKEGLALMTLAEALLRVPDAATADRFIEDRLGSGDFAHHIVRSDAFLVSASSWALGMTARLIHAGETPETTLAALARRLGAPAVRAAARQAMRVMGNHFVLGQTIESAIDRTRSGSGRAYRYSFDMLGEGARTAIDARRYFDSYAAAIDTIGERARETALPERPGISVKLSALHPRYEALSHPRVMAELVPLAIELARQAKRHDLNFTVDAEEADRLELSLDVFAAVLADPSLAGWSGLGLAVQAYQKRAGAVIDHVAELARRFDRRLMVRLVKGAYWDTEVKRAQERGLADFPVFTRKAMTDLNYLACAQKLLSLRPRLYPQFATHNALTVASILERAGDAGGFEFQRLHGMGEALYARLLERRPALACRTYAPVGGHRDLLAYLVRRLLENGANSSFVSRAADPAVPVEALLRRPVDTIGDPTEARHPRLALPRDLYGPGRLNSRGVEFGDRAALKALLAEIDRRPRDAPAIGDAERAVAAAKAGFATWDRTPADERGRVLERAADLLEERRGRFIGLLQSEGGKTIDDAVSEVREAIDYCRYYAGQGRLLFGAGAPLPGPTGESNLLRLRGRGVFVAISPWNFPLAIFLGQIVGALAAGNSVVAKPAEQTPRIAVEAVRLLHEAGIPTSALQFVTGDGDVGAELVRHPDIAGVVFTGSTEVARAINRSLAAKDGPIAVLIAETGGINAMIVDATALPEQVCDDVLASAFRSAGQRCSALRLLCLQDDVADRMIEMIVGAVRELKLGDPADLSVQVGPVIDAEAKAKLEGYLARVKSAVRVHYVGDAPAEGTFVAPHILELADPAELKEEVFGPVLHVVRYPADGLERVLAAIEGGGYGLTLGIHTRIDDVAEKITNRLAVGNVYVNRNIIGAVVGVQPFGGHHLSGTGPKAGGPHYLLRFAAEQTVTVNTAAVGGNAALMAQSEGDGTRTPHLR
jgi:RHH-type transcriptional regulator, proline utilization regulon repressor / proline dehydrogenase / delta 1-pyrroline-5-carboxylate dehydrogenase